MSTISDPLLDLGWLLAIWPEEDGAPDQIDSALSRAGGLPRPAELIERYAEGSERDLSAVDWYTVLACFKLGIVLEGTHARAFAGRAAKSHGDWLHMAALGLFARAAQDSPVLTCTRDGHRPDRGADLIGGPSPAVAERSGIAGHRLRGCRRPYGDPGSRPLRLHRSPGRRHNRISLVGYRRC